jgi:hypothetical protein
VFETGFRAFGVDPLSWIPHHLGEENPRKRINSTNEFRFLLESDLTAGQMAKAKRQAEEWKRTRQEQP